MSTTAFKLTLALLAFALSPIALVTAMRANNHATNLSEPVVNLQAGAAPGSLANNSSTNMYQLHDVRDPALTNSGATK